MSNKRAYKESGRYVLDEETAAAEIKGIARNGGMNEEDAVPQVGMFAQSARKPSPRRGQEDDSVGAEALPNPARQRRHVQASGRPEPFIGAHVINDIMDEEEEEPVPGAEAIQGEGVDEEEGTVFYRTDDSISPVSAQVVDIEAEAQLRHENEELRQFRQMVENAAVAEVVAADVSQGRPIDIEAPQDGAGGVADGCFKLQCSNRRMMWLAIGTIVLVLVAVGTTLGVLLPQKSNQVSVPVSGSTTTTTTTQAPMPSPTSTTTRPPSTTTTTQFPTPAPAWTLQALTNFLSSVSFDGGAALQTTGTPQNDALIWLAADASLNTYSDERIIQRYVLATVYHSFQGHDWTNNDNWLDGGDECEWYYRLSPLCTVAGAIVRLVLSENNLVEDIPPEIGLLSGSLEELDLWGNALTGSIPSELGVLTKLTKLELDGNSLTGGVPTELGHLKNLVRSNLWGNSLTGSIPNELGALTKLTRLELQQNYFMETIPTELGLLTNLDWLTLWQNELTGSIPNELGNLTKLTVLSLQENKLKGTVPSTFNQLTNLDILRLHDNMLTGTFSCPAYIDKCWVSCDSSAEECRSLP